MPCSSPSGASGAASKAVAISTNGPGLSAKDCQTIADYLGYADSMEAKTYSAYWSSNVAATLTCQANDLGTVEDLIAKAQELDCTMGEALDAMMEADAAAALADSDAQLMAPTADDNPDTDTDGLTVGECKALAVFMGFECSGDALADPEWEDNVAAAEKAKDLGTFDSLADMLKVAADTNSPLPLLVAAASTTEAASTTDGNCDGCDPEECDQCKTFDPAWVLGGKCTKSTHTNQPGGGTTETFHTAHGEALWLDLVAPGAGPELGLWVVMITKLGTSQTLASVAYPDTFNGQEKAKALAATWGMFLGWGWASKIEAPTGLSGKESTTIVDPNGLWLLNPLTFCQLKGMQDCARCPAIAECKLAEDAGISADLLAEVA